MACKRLALVGCLIVDFADNYGYLAIPVDCDVIQLLLSPDHLPGVDEEVKVSRFVEHLAAGVCVTEILSQKLLEKAEIPVH